MLADTRLKIENLRNATASLSLSTLKRRFKRHKNRGLM